MTNRPLENLIELGSENLNYLRTSLQSVSRGQLYEVKRIASTIRTLVHDTKDSHSLIKQLEAHPDNKHKEPMVFFDKFGIPEYMEKNTYAIYIGCQIPIMPLNQSPEEFNNTFRVDSNRDRWWNRIILVTPIQGKKKWSRKDFTLQYANKDGGSHVDPILPTDLHTAQDSLQYVGEGAETGIGYIVMYEAGISLAQSFYNYLEKIKNVS